MPAQQPHNRLVDVSNRAAGCPKLPRSSQLELPGQLPPHCISGAQRTPKAPPSTTPQDMLTEASAKGQPVMLGTPRRGRLSMLGPPQGGHLSCWSLRKGPPDMLGPPRRGHLSSHSCTSRPAPSLLCSLRTLAEGTCRCCFVSTSRSTLAMCQ